MSFCVFQIPVLMHELIATEVWKQNVWPQLVDMEFEPKTTFPIYMVVSDYTTWCAFIRDLAHFQLFFKFLY